MGTLLTLIAPTIAMGGSGVLLRLLMGIVSGSQTRKNNREDAINHRISGNSGTFDPSLDAGSRDTANYIAHSMCNLFVVITLVCLCYPNAEYHIFLPETISQRSIDLVIFSYTWNSNLGNSVLTINSGGVVYISLNFCIFVMSAFYKGDGAKASQKK